MNKCGIFRCFPHPTLSLASEQILKDLKKIPGAPTRRWGEWIWLTGLSGLHRNSPQGLNISSVRVFDQIRDPEMPIIFVPKYNITFVTSPTSQLILQPFRCFTYVTAQSRTLLSLLLRHRIFTYVIWRAAQCLDRSVVIASASKAVFKPQSLSIWKLRDRRPMLKNEFLYLSMLKKNCEIAYR